MKMHPADLRDIDFKEFVVFKIKKELSVWQGTEDIGSALKLLKQCLEDNQFIRAVLKDASKDFSYEYYVGEELEIDEVTVTITDIQWEVDVDSNSLTQSVNFDGDVLAGILKRDDRELDELTEEENSEYIQKEREIEDEIQDEALDKWGDEYEIDEVFEPLKKAFIKHFIVYAKQHKVNLDEDQIDTLLEYGINVSKEPYDISEYATCMIKMAITGVEHNHIKLVSELIHGSFELVTGSVFKELFSNHEFSKIEQ